MSFSISLLQHFFSPCQNIEKFYIAYSGGLDSTVLLHAMHAAKLPIHAVHVNHHLQQESDSWQQHCENVCSKLTVPLTVQHAQIAKTPQKSLEESARNARYELLRQPLEENSAIVTAHHQDDVAETVLLQLLRGSGPAGLAAMPACKKMSIGVHLRPLLPYSRVELLEYAKSTELVWIEDPSNEINDFDRNYLRNEVMPMIKERWPAAQQALSRSASLQADMLSCLQELALIDIKAAATEVTTAVTTAIDYGQADQILDVKALQELSPERLNNVLRYWVRSNDMRVPSKKILQQIVSDIVLNEEMDSSPLQSWKEGEIRRFRNHLFLMRPLTPHDASQVIRWKIDQPLFIQSLNRTLLPEELEDNNLNLPDDVKELTVRFREGGERLKPFGSKQHRSLKNLLLEAEIPPWERERIPLLFHNDKLISVLGYWNVTWDSETTF
jgi:tRNA(Ile)-lysidine synthase